MNSGPYSQAVIVRRGFFASLASGFFMFLSVAVVCAAGLGFYGMNVLDRHAATVIGIGNSFLLNLPDWENKLPPILADALRDRRDPAYRDQIDTSVSVVTTDSRDRGGVAVVIAENKGKSTISYLVARIVLRDESGVPVHGFTTHLATPMAFDNNDARGPILPGSKREIPIRVRDERVKSATLELTDLRTFVEKASETDSEKGGTASGTDRRKLSFVN